MLVPSHSDKDILQATANTYSMCITYDLFMDTIIILVTAMHQSQRTGACSDSYAIAKKQRHAHAVPCAMHQGPRLVLIST